MESNWFMKMRTAAEQFPDPHSINHKFCYSRLQASGEMPLRSS